MASTLLAASFSSLYCLSSAGVQPWSSHLADLTGLCTCIAAATPFRQVTDCGDFEVEKGCESSEDEEEWDEHDPSYYPPDGRLPKRRRVPPKQDAAAKRATAIAGAIAAIGSLLLAVTRCPTKVREMLKGHAAELTRAGCRSPCVFPIRPVDPLNAASYPTRKSDVAVAVIANVANDNKLVYIVLQFLVAYGQAFSWADANKALAETDERGYGGGAYGKSNGAALTTHAVLQSIFDADCQLEVLGTPELTVAEYILGCRGFDVSHHARGVVVLFLFPGGFFDEIMPRTQRA